MGNASGVPSDRTSTVKDFRSRYENRQLSAFTHGTVSEGICHGMCLDWMRLSLNGRPELFLEYTMSGTEHAGLILQQQERMHYLFHTASGAVTDELTQDLNKLLRQAKGDPSSPQVKRAKLALRELGAQAKDTDQMYSLYYERFRSEFRSAFVSFLTFDQIDIDFGVSSDRGDPTRNLTDWFAGIRTFLELLPTNRCALFHMTGPRSGHFIAFQRTSTAYYLFDPNVGWYNAGDLPSVWEMFQDLWYAAYRTFGYNESRWRAFRAR